MSIEITHDGIRLVPSRDAARRFNITNDYIGRLCKQQKVVGKLISGSWYVNEESLRDFLLKVNREKYERREALREQRAYAYREAQARILGETAPATKKFVVVEKKATPLPPRPLRIHASPRRISKSVTSFAHRGLAVMFAVIVVVGGLRFSDASVFQMAREALPAAAAITGRNDLLARGTNSAIADFFGLGSANNSYWIWYETSGETKEQPTFSPGVAEEPSVIGRIVEVLVPDSFSGITETLLDARLAAFEQRMIALISLVPPGNSVPDVYHYVNNAASSFNNIAITDSSYTGGTITDATITGGSVTATAFNGVVPVANGGTGTSTYAAGDILYATSTDALGRLPVGSNGQVLKVVGGNLAWSLDLSGGGGGSGAFATTTDDLAIYVADPSDVVIIGDTATSTTGNILEVLGNTLLRGALTAYSTITAPIFTATSTSATSTLPLLDITGALGLGSDYLTDITGSGLSIQSGALTLDTSGNWTGTFDGQEGSYYLANSFSTTSADYYVSQANLTGFSTTSADYWSSLGLGFSTTSANYWQTTRDFFSTTSASYFLSQNQGNAFSTTSAINFVNASTTIPKTYTANTFNALQTFTNASSTYFSSTYASSTNLLAGAFTLGTLNGPLQANAGVVSATTSIGVLYGGTGLTSAPTYGQMLIGQADGTYQLVATSSLGITSGGSSFSYLFPDNATSTTLTFNSGLMVVGSTTINGNATTTGMLGVGSLFINNEQFSDLTGTGLQNSGGVLTLNTSGDWTGTFDGLEGSAYLANSFSTTSADYWETQQTSRSADDLSDNSIEDLNDVAAMTENYGDLLYWNGSAWADIATSSLGLPTSATLASYLALSDWYATTTDGLDEGLTNRYFTEQRATDNFIANLAATTSIASIISLPNLSITSSQVSNFSDSVNSFIHASTTIPKTYTTNTFTALQTFNSGLTTNAFTLGTLNGPLQANNGVVSATTSIGVLYGGTGLTSAPTYGQLLVGNASGGYTLTATSSLGIASGGSSFAYPFPNNATSTLLTFSGGIIANASSTIGNGTQAGGLTISGGATTTGSLWVEGNVTSNAFIGDGSQLTNLAAGNISGTLGTINSTTFNRGDSITITAASSTLLTDSNTFTALQSFTNASSTLFSSVYASSTRLFAGAFTLGSLNGPLQANNGVVSATSSILAIYGGTGQTSYAVGDILYADSTGSLSRLPVGGQGTVLKINSGVPSWQTDLTSGGGGGATAWSTTTDSLAIYPTDTTDVLIVGANATTTTNSILEVFGRSYFSQNVGIGTTSAGSLLSIGNVANFAPGGSTLYSSLTLGNLTATGTVAFTDLSSGFVGSNNGTLYSFATSSLGFLSNYDAFTHPSVGVSATTSGLIVTASSTIGNGTQAGGLTISGGATTTGNAYIAGTLGVGTNTNLNGALTANGTFSVQAEGDIFRQYDSGDAAWYPIIARYNTANGTFPASTYIFGNGTNARVGIETPGGGNVSLLQVRANLATFNGGLTAVNATTTNLGITGLPNALLATRADGTVYATTSLSSLLVDTSGNWTGTFDGLEGSAYLANSFSTTSADYWETQQTARSADDLSNNSIEDLSDVAAMTENYGDLLYWNGSSWADIATSSLGLPTSATLASYLALSDWYATTTDGLDEGLTNRYFTEQRATDNFIANLAATTSVASIISLPNLSITSSQVSNFNDSVNSFIHASTTIPKTYTSNTYTALQTFANASSTFFSSTYASTTNLFATTASTSNLTISNVANTLLKTNASGQVVAAIAGTDYLAGGAGSATTTLSTSGALSFSANPVVFGSSPITLSLATTTNSLFTGTPGQVLAYTNNGWTGVATTTAGTGLTYTGTAFNVDLGTTIDSSEIVNNSILNEDINASAAISVSKLALTAGDGLTLTGDDLDCDTANGSTFGCLLAGDWTSFNNKVSSSSLSTFLAGNKDWQIIAGGALAPTTTRGIVVSASSTIGNSTQGGGLTISGGATTTGNAYFAGNLGIGTSSPYAKLSVVGQVVGANFTATTTAVNTFPTLLSTNATTTNLGITSLTNALLATRADGTVYGTTTIGSNLLDTSGNWTGTFDNQEGTYYLDRANHTGTQLASTISDFNTAVNSFIHASTTIPKTYTSNTFSALQTFNAGLTTNAFTLGSLNGPLQANNGVVSATSSIGVLYGGTGLTSAPSYGQLLLGNSSGGYSLTATSSLGLPTFAYLFPSNATSTLLALNGGLTAYASSTIGNGTQAGGLTINGGATTTGYINVLGTATSSFAGPLAISSSGTSTFANGIQLSAGCFRGPDGICVTNPNLSAYVDGAGSGATNRVAYWSDSNTLTSNASLTFDGTTFSAGQLVANSSNPFFGLDDTDTSGYEFSIDANDSGVTFYSDVSNSAGNSFLAFSVDGVENARFDTSGRFGIGSTSPAARLSINSFAGDAYSLWVGSTTNPWLRVSNTGFGTTTLSGLNISGSATSTSNVGLNLSGGCFAINGTCLGGGSSLTGTQGQVAYFSGTDTAVGTSSIFITPTGNVGIGTTTSYERSPFFSGYNDAKVRIDSSSASTTGQFSGLYVGGTQSAARPLGTVVGASFEPMSTAAVSGLYGSLFAPTNIGGDVTLNVGVYSRPQNISGTSSVMYGGYFGPSHMAGTSTAMYGVNVLPQISGGTVTDVYGLASTPIIVGASVNSYTGLHLATGAIFGVANVYGVNQEDTAARNIFMGRTGVGTSTPYAKLTAWGGTTGNIFEAVTSASSTALSVSGTGFGTTTLSGLNISGSATSTSNVGFNITSGCYAINGACISGGGASGANDFTFANNFNVLTAATSSPIWAQSGIFASSTSQFAEANFFGTLNFASTSTTTLALARGIPFIKGGSSSDFNTAVGRLAMRDQISGTINTALGDAALQNATSTNNNTAIGWAALASPIKVDTTGGSANTALGAGALTAATAGYGNVALGASAGAAGASGSYNIFLGNAAQQSGAVSGSNNILIGGNSLTGIRLPSASASNQLNIQNIIYGVNNAGTGSTISSGNIGIGTSTPHIGRLTIASTTGPQIALSAGAGIAQWTFRNAGGDLFFSTSTIDGLATTSTAALSISGSGFGTTTIRGLNILGQATSTSNVGFNLSAGCYAINGTCISGGGGSGVVGSGVVTQIPYYAANGTALTATSTMQIQNDGSVRFEPGGGNNVGNVDIAYQDGYISLSVNEDTGNNYASLYSDAASTGFTMIGASSRSIILDTNANSYFNTSGNLGIGTTSPWGLLSVNPNSITGPSFVIGSSTATQFIVTNGGNVGIGTTSPISLLDVRGSSAVTQTIGWSTNTSYGGLEFYEGSDWMSGIYTSGSLHNTVARRGDIEFFSNNDLTFWPGNIGSPSVTMLATGNVGIGTSTPYAKLTAWGGTTGNIFEAVTSASSTALSVSGTGFGTTTLSGLNISGSATSTSNVGFNLSGGCYAINGTCVGGGSSSSFDYLFPSNATSTLLSFNGGLSTSALTLGSLNGPLHANAGVVTATTSIGVLYGGTGLTTAPAYGQLLLGQADGTYALTATSSLGITGGSTGDQIAIIVDQKTDGTEGGTFTSGAWQTRDLNTELHDDIGVSISSNEFTLPAGTYQFHVTAPAYFVDYHQSRLYNVTDAAVALIGTSEFSDNTSGGQTSNISVIVGTVTIASTKTFRIEHQASATNATHGLGVFSTFSGVPEIYTTVQIRKLNGSATVTTFTGASASADGTAGLVPQPLAGEHGSVLLGNGNWLASTTLFVNTTNANLGIGTTSPYAKLTAWGGATGNIFEAVTSASSTALSISATGFGTTTLSGLNISGSATSTSNVGFNLSGGCYAINGTCVGGGSGSSFTYPFPAGATSSPLMLLASTTIGGGTAVTGLTVSGNATTTGNLAVTGGLITTSDEELVLEQTGGLFGATRLRIMNGVGTNGAMFENTAGSLVDFIFKTDTNQQNVRYQTDATGLLAGNIDGQFNIGDPSGTNAGFVTGSVTSAFRSRLGVGTTSPYASLTAWGGTTGNIFEAVTSASSTALSISATGNATTTLSGLNIAGSATSTSNVGFNITSGCYAINGTCVGGGSGSSFAYPFPSGATSSALSLTGRVTFGGGGYIEESSEGTWINMPTTGVTGLGSGGAGSNAWIGYASGDGYWLDDALTGDLAYRNTTGSLRFSTATGNSQMVLHADTGNLGIGTSTPWAKLSVNPIAGDTGPAFAIGSSTANMFSVTRSGIGSIFNFGMSSTSTIPNNTANAWTIATSSSASPLFRIDTTSGAEEVSIGSPYATTDILIGNPSGTGDSNMQFGEDNNAWSVGNYSTDKSFRIASSTNFTSNVALTITKGAEMNVGIGTTSPWRTLSVVGTVAINGLSAVAGTDQSVCIDNTTKELTTQSGDTCAVSSARYKNTIESLDIGGLEMLRSLRPVSFLYNQDAASTTHWGFIAEELASSSPNLAAWNPDGSVQTLNSVAITAVLAKALQELDVKVSLATGQLVSAGTFETVTASTTNTSLLCLSGECRSAWGSSGTTTLDLSAYASKLFVGDATTTLSTNFGSALTNATTTLAADFNALVLSASTSLSTSFDSALSSAMENRASSTASAIAFATSTLYSTILGDLNAATTSLYTLLQSELLAMNAATTTETDITPLSATTSAFELVTASTTATSTPWVASFASSTEALRAGIESLGETIVHVFTRAFYATVGIFEKVFAREVHTDLLCVSGEDGETCITKAQLDALLASAAVASEGEAPEPESEPETPPAEETPEETPDEVPTEEASEEVPTEEIPTEESSEEETPAEEAPAEESESEPESESQPEPTPEPVAEGGSTL